MIMKALSLKQPYAELITTGKKTIEIRSWNTKFRGKFYVHASGNTINKAMKKYGYTSLAKRSIIGTAELVDVIKYGSDEEFLKDSDKHLVTKENLEEFGWTKRKKYGFLLKNAKKIELPVKRWNTSLNKGSPP